MPLVRIAPFALLTTELVTNAAKHAYAPAQPARITVTLDPMPLGSVTLFVRDEGKGLPEDFEIATDPSLGMKIIRALVEQMGAQLSVTRLQPGTEFLVTIPLATE